MTKRLRKDAGDKPQADTNPASTPGDIGFLQGLRSIVEAEVQRAIQNLKPSQVIDSKYPACPTPVLKGKKFVDSDRLKLSVMVDRVLIDEIKMAGIETGRSYSEIVNSALWFYFQKPPLSFQKDKK
jgi:hypothetical protein